MPLYEVAIVRKPTENAAKDGEGEKLILGPKTVVAKDERVAIVVAIADAPGAVWEGIAGMEDRTEVLVRPFK